MLPYAVEFLEKRNNTLKRDTAYYPNGNSFDLADLRLRLEDC